MCSRPTLMQFETLVEFLEQNPDIAKGLVRTAQAKLETKKKWEYLATTLNSLGGAYKSGQGWAKYWAEKKHALKKACARHTASMRRTDGEPADDLSELSALDKRLVAVIGGQQCAIEAPRLAVDSFSQSSRDVQSSPPHSDPVTEDTHLETDGVKVEVLHITVKEEENIPSSPIADPSGDEQTDTPPSPTISEPQQQPVRHRSRCAKRKCDDVMDKLAQIEERRVNAETVTAHAFADLAATLQRNVVAIENLSNAMSHIATGVQGLSAIANAILVMANTMQQ